MEYLQLNDLRIEVEKKAIKNVHLSVNPPNGHVKIAAPQNLKMETIRAFVLSKLAWIRLQQNKMKSQEREPKREYIDRESHYVWGQRCLLKVIENDVTPSVQWQVKKLILSVRPDSSSEKKHDIVDGWYRKQLRETALPLIDKWEKIIGVSVNKVFIRRMKTRWGSCNSKRGTIRLNTDLAKKPLDCLEYIVVHELVHLIEPTHNQNFVFLMNKYLPGWEQRRILLNQLPVRHEIWKY